MDMNTCCICHYCTKSYFIFSSYRNIQTIWIVYKSPRNIDGLWIVNEITWPWELLSLWRFFLKLRICNCTPESSSFLFSMFPLDSFIQAFTNVLWRSSLQEIPVKHGFLRQRHSLRAICFGRFQWEVLKWVNPEQGPTMLREDTAPQWAELATDPHGKSSPHSVLPTTPKIGATEICSSFVFRRSSFPWIFSRIKPTHFLDSQCPLEN